MFQLNEEFLKELGLDQLPEDQQKSLLQHIYSELELRVGERLSQGMSNAQLEEFAGIIDKTPGAVDDFLMKHAPNYRDAILGGMSAPSAPQQTQSDFDLAAQSVNLDLMTADKFFCGHCFSAGCDELVDD